MIKAPFNFVPLSDKVFFPDWADQISHDIPFQDGLSGSVELKIVAETPIFVRNGHTKSDAEANENHGNDAFHLPSNVDNRYFIPGTSVKGCIRSVLEIMSFGKMRLNKSAKFAQRTWDDEMLYPMKKEQGKLRCGWIKRNGDDYELLDCGNPMRIAMERIDDYVGSKIMENHFSKGKGVDLNVAEKIDGNEFDRKSAAYKYKLLKGYVLSNLRFDYDDEYCNQYKDNRVKVSPNGDFQGSIILTGQPDRYMFPRPTKLTGGAGKFYEFVFLNKVENRYPISKEEFDHYKFIYSDSSDWKFAQTRSDGMPVFFREERGRIKDWGLAFLYKLPYDKTPYETLNPSHKSEGMDLADCIFGCISDKYSLKGRVQFSNAFSENASLCESIRLSLGSPKASYYPIYVQQDGRGGKVSQYQTYNDGAISGWKRYVVRRDYFHRDMGNDNIDTIIRPLASGSEFICNMRFHNLKKEELGALLSAITFHGSSDCFHQIGQGKPYGFGKVSISINNLRFSEGASTNVKDYMVDFEGMLVEKYNKSWVAEPQITELFAMAHNEVTDNDIFDYLRMSTNARDNEFLAVKAAKEYLQTYTALTGKLHVVESLYEPIREERRCLKAKEESDRQAERNINEYIRQIENITFNEDLTAEECDRYLSLCDEAKKFYERELLASLGVENRHDDIVESLGKIKAKIKSGKLGDSFLAFLQTKGNKVKGVSDLAKIIKEWRKSKDFSEDEVNDIVTYLNTLDAKKKESFVKYIDNKDLKQALGNELFELLKSKV